MCGERCFFCPGLCLSGYIQPALPYWWRSLEVMQPVKKKPADTAHYLKRYSRHFRIENLKSSKDTGIEHQSKTGQ